MPFTRRLLVINEPFLDEHALVAASPGLADEGRRAHDADTSGR
jgi:hypothetical protein